MIFHRELEWTGSNTWVPSGTGEWKQFISKGVRYQPTPLGLPGGQAGSPMGDLYYVGAQANQAWPNAYYEPIWHRDLGTNGYIRQLGANNIAIYNLFLTPSHTMEAVSGISFVQPASGVIPTTTLIANNPYTNQPFSRAALPAPGPCTLPQYPPDSPVTNNWVAIDFSVQGPLRYNNTAPGAEWPPSAVFPEGFFLTNGVPVKQPPPHYYHFNHDRFLDICWNGGMLEGTSGGQFTMKLDPVYVWLAIGVSTTAFPKTGSNDPQSPSYYKYWQDYYNNLAAWMAQAYGQHPAVVGFIITNETNDGNDGSYEYFHYLNAIHRTIKKHAPDKLTMVGFQDDPNSLTKKVKDPSTGQEVLPTTIYEPDVIGWNLYGAPTANTDIVQLYNGTNPPTQPVILSEIGVPASTRYSTVPGVTNTNGSPYLLVPNGYYIPTNDPPATPATNAIYTGTLSGNPNGYLLGTNNPHVIVMSAAEWSRFQDNGKNDRRYGKYYHSGLVVGVRTTSSPHFHFLENPSTEVWHHLNSRPELLPLMRTFSKAPYNRSPGAGTAVILWSWLQGATNLNVGQPGGVFSGYMVFEYTDEWDKWNDAGISNDRITVAAGVQDFSAKSIVPWTATFDGGEDPITLHTTWDEEWFGLMTCQSTNRASTSQPISSYGWLNDGPDQLQPRMTYYAVQQIMRGTNVPVTPP